MSANVPQNQEDQEIDLSHTRRRGSDSYVAWGGGGNIGQ